MQPGTLKMQFGGTRRLGRILGEDGCHHQRSIVSKTLAAQFEQPIVDIEKEYSTTAEFVPRYLCKKFEVFPLGIEQGNILRM